MNELLRLAILFEKTSKHIDKLKGGLADKNTPSDFDDEALNKGIEVELSEHTKDRDIAREIAMDHLTESSDYYDLLEEMEEKF